MVGSDRIGVVHSLSDEELVAHSRAAACPLEARRFLEELFGRQQSRVLSWCYRLTGDREWAADLAQDILMKAFCNLDSFRVESKFSTWLYTITRNHCFKEIRTKALEPDGVNEAVLNSVAAPDEDPYTQLARENNARLATSFLRDVLTEPEIQVLTLHYGEDLPLDAVTRILGLQNPSGAKAYIVTAKRKLRSISRRRKSRARVSITVHPS